MAEAAEPLFGDKKWSLRGMTALVTGGTRGIGLVIVTFSKFTSSVSIFSCFSALFGLIDYVNFVSDMPLLKNWHDLEHRCIHVAAIRT